MVSCFQFYSSFDGRNHRIFPTNRMGGTVKIATKPQTENYILGEMQKQVIEEYTNLKVGND